ncbi:uncharacterized protein [Enoplosus armatus]|uniref:uncharacterized protein n=1 Tax=Enoplosus armatus TaxID=215367 RepID=UPI0039922704
MEVCKMEVCKIFVVAVEAACKKITGEVKDKLSEVVADATVKSLEVQTEEEEDFPSESKHNVRERADRRTEEDGAFPGSCRACKSIVSKVKQKIGGDRSKAKIRQLLNNVCNRVKCRLIRSACKTIVRKFKNKLIDAIATLGSPCTICVKLKLCKRNKPVYQ